MASLAYIKNVIRPITYPLRNKLGKNFSRRLAPQNMWNFVYRAVHSHISPLQTDEELIVAAAEGKKSAPPRYDIMIADEIEGWFWNPPSFF